MIYVNYAGLAPLRPRSYLASLFAPELLGNVRVPQWMAQVKHLKEQIARWLGVEPEQVALMPNTSLGLMSAAYAPDWQAGDGVLYPARDFPSNMLPWQRLARFGVEARAVTDWNAPWPETTRMVAVSTVDFSTGNEQPWQEVVRRAHRRKIWTCVDAIQSAAVKPAYVPEIDFWCCGAQKWLVSGTGIAIMVLSKRAMKELEPPFPNWLGLNDPPDPGSGQNRTARGWELGGVGPGPTARLSSSLAYFEKTGWNVVTREVKKRRDYLHEQLLEIGWQVVSNPEHWSGIVSFDPGKDSAGNSKADLIVQDGYRHRIVTIRRGDFVRLSPHVFTSMKQLKKVSQWLSKCHIEYR